MNIDLSPLVISINTTIISTIITFILGILAAYYVVYYSKNYKNLIDGIFNLPLVLPPTVVGFFLLLIFGRYGPIGKVFYKFGVNIIFSWTATVIAATVVAFPLMYKTTRAAFEQIDSNIINAAKTLGISNWKLFFRIIIPLSWPGIVAGTILAFARALGEFGATLMIAGNIPKKTQTIPMAIYFLAQSGQMDEALFWVIIISGFSFFIIYIMNYWLDILHTVIKR